jgi:hypothetical protein
MANFVETTRTGLEKRLKELKPLYDEYLQLEKLKSALSGVDGPRRGPGRPRGSTTRTRRGGRRRGRRGDTTAQALEVVRQNPGITVREIADRIGARHPNYLYRVMGKLQSERAVKKEGRGYVAR